MRSLPLVSVVENGAPVNGAAHARRLVEGLTLAVDVAVAYLPIN